MADDARVSLVAPFVRVTEVDAEALQEALVAQDVDGRLRDGEIQHCNLGIGRLVAKLGLRPLADEKTGLEVVGSEGRISCVDRVERGIERNHQHAGIAGVLHGIDDRLGVGRRQQDALGAVGDAGLDRRDLAFMIAIDLAGI